MDMIKDIDGKAVKLTKIAENKYTFDQEMTFGHNRCYLTYFTGTITLK